MINKKVAGLWLVIGFLAIASFVTHSALAQVETSTDGEASSAATSSIASEAASSTAAGLIEQQRSSEKITKDTTRPEQLPEKAAILALFAERPIESPGVLNFMGYWVQQAVNAGIPANTIFLILLTPLLALIVSFTRVVVGLPTLDMLVPIALSFAFVAVSVEVGLLLLFAIILAAYVSKIVLKNVRVMFYPKRSLSMIFLSLFVFAALTVALGFEVDRIASLSIFPILILMLLGDSIVSVQLHKSASETFVITTTTIALGLLGYALASSTMLQNTLILYPEWILVAIPMNLLIGRYFGLRVLEYLRFNSMSQD